jgi:hypothetical protein
MIPHHIVRSPAYFITERFGGQNSIFIGHFALIKPLGGTAIASGKIRGFHIGPGQLLIAVSFVVLSLFLAVGSLFTTDAAAAR